jgi:endoglucanase
MASSLFAAALLVTGAFAQQSQWGQCGGVGWSGPTTCTSGNTCTKQNDYYYQCIPGGSGGSPTTSSQPPTQTGGNGGGSTGKTQYFGVNLAGFDFGCATNGNCDTTKIYPPVRDFNGANNYPDGVGQMKHFHDDLGMNFFRLPVGWQYLVNNQLGGTLNSNNLAQYDKLVQGCRSISGAQCIIDIHNYARWNGGIIGQGGPSDDQFVSLWRQLATKYASQTNVWFGIMNEPHDVNIQTWGQTVQKVVTAIRQAGATNNYITLPGNGWQSAGTFISDGSAAALSQVKNPDGTTNKLIIDVHKYLDSDNSGTTTTCVTNNIDNAFAPLANWLRQNGRKAILTESGGGNTDSCLRYFCEQIKYLNQNSDVYLGYTGWSAGSFDSTYELVLTPTWNGNGWTDRALTKCLLQ